MKQQWAKYLIVALAGVAVGRLLPGERSESRRLSEIGTEEGRKTRSSLRDQAGPSSRIELLRREIRSTPAQNLPRLFQRSLEINNPFERREAMTEILKHASASGGMAFMEEFVKITRETGRTHGEEWRDTLFEVGRKGGAEMMDTWKASGKGGGSHEAWFSFYGMSFEDPKAGKAWLNLPSNEDFPQRERLISALIGGATLSNADEGIRMMAELPEAARLDSIGHFTWNLIQNSGLDRAVDWMLEIQKTSAKSEPDYALAVENEIHNKIREAAEGRDGAAEMAGFLARINQAAPISAGRLATTLSRMPGTSGLDVLDHLAQTPTLANSGVVDSTLGELARQAGGDSPEAVKHWLELHPSSPLAPTIRQLLELAPAN